MNYSGWLDASEKTICSTLDIETVGTREMNRERIVQIALFEFHPGLLFFLPQVWRSLNSILKRCSWEKMLYPLLLFVWVDLSGIGSVKFPRTIHYLPDPNLNNGKTFFEPSWVNYSPRASATTIRVYAGDVGITTERWIINHFNYESQGTILLHTSSCFVVDSRTCQGLNTPNWRLAAFTGTYCSMLVWIITLAEIINIPFVNFPQEKFIHIVIFHSLESVLVFIILGKKLAPQVKML